MITGVLTFVLLLFLSLLMPGVINRVRARLSGRKGMSLWQHIYNVELLMKKGAVYSPATTLLFRVAPSVYLGAALAALLFIPLGGMKPMMSFEGDVVMVAYLLALGRVALILAAMDTASSFEGMGASREALYGALTEPAFFAIAGTLALVTGQTSFEAIFSGTGAVEANMTIVLLLLTYLLFKMITVEAGRIPVDDPRTHLELTMIHEVMVLDYSGIDLAMITIGGWIKTGVLSAIAAATLAGCFWPTALATGLIMPCIAVAIGVVESMQARNKLSRNTTYILTIVSLAIVVFFVAYMIMTNIVEG